MFSKKVLTIRYRFVLAGLLLSNSLVHALTPTISMIAESSLLKELPASEVAMFMTQAGADTKAKTADDNSGISVSLSDDGLTMAVGAYFNDGANGLDSGIVRIYKNVSGAWTQVGADIIGEAAGDQSGASVSLSGDGLSVAIGADLNDGVNGANSGHVRVYSYDGASWKQKGADIDGEAAGDWSGSSVSLSDNGLTVAVGAIFNEGASGMYSGHVRVYKFNDNSWKQTGTDIDGEASYDLSGTSVSLCDNGTTVAVGADLNDGANGRLSGHVRIYSYNGTSWKQTGADIDGEAAGEQSGISVSLRDNGHTVAIGALNNDVATASAHVRIYRYNGTSWTQTGIDTKAKVLTNKS